MMPPPIQNDRTPPPMFGPRPAMDQTCGRWLGDTNCGERATWHFLWTEDGENGLCCDEHAAEALRTWSHHDKHPITEICTMPDSSWFFSWDEPPGLCRWTVSESTLHHVNALESVGVGGQRDDH